VKIGRAIWYDGPRGETLSMPFQQNAERPPTPSRSLRELAGTLEAAYLLWPAERPLRPPSSLSTNGDSPIRHRHERAVELS
jgi:hypothetical protein